MAMAAKGRTVPRVITQFPESFSLPERTEKEPPGQDGNESDKLQKYKISICKFVIGPLCALFSEV